MSSDESGEDEHAVFKLPWRNETVSSFFHTSAVKLAGFLVHNLSEDVGGTWCRRLCQGKVVKDQWTHGRFLCESTGMVRGLSERSVQWFFASKEIKPTSRVDD